MTSDLASDLYAALLQLAAGQYGPFTWRQASALGWTSHAAKLARASGEWRRLYRGVYVYRVVWDSLDARGRHRCRASARVLACGQGWHAARRTAAVVHDLPLLGPDPAIPQLVRSPAKKTDNAASRHERVAVLDPEDVTTVLGVPVTSMARTAVDLARDESFRSAVITADAALRAGVSNADLLAAARRCASWPGGLKARRVADFADGLAESPLESLSRTACLEVGLPAPELQINVFLEGELLARLDFFWRDANLAGLADGAVKYDSTADVIAEKWQVERLEDLGFEVVRWGWEHAYRPQGVLDDKVRRGLARGARQALDPRVRLVATTIEQNKAANLAIARRLAS